MINFIQNLYSYMRQSGIFKRSPSALLDFDSIFVIKSTEKKPQFFKSLTQKTILQQSRQSVGVKNLLKHVIADKFTKKHLNDTCIFKPTKSLKDKIQKKAQQNIKVHKRMIISGLSQYEGEIKRTKSSTLANIITKQQEKQQQKIIDKDNIYNENASKYTNSFIKNQHSISYKDKKSYLKQQLRQGKSAQTLNTTNCLIINRELKSQMRMRANCVITEVNLQISKSRQSLQSNLLNPEQITQSLRLKQRKQLNKRFLNRIKRFKYKDFHHNSTQVDRKDVKNHHLKKDFPNQLQINKVVFPKRENRQEFLANIKKLKSFTINIHQSQQKKQKQMSKWMEKQTKNVTYKIKIKRHSKSKKDQDQEDIYKDTNNNFLSRVDWQKFSNEPFLPWSSQYPQKQKLAK